MTWETHNARATFARYAADWDRLNAQLYDNHPYFDSRFVGPMLDYFADGTERLCLHHDEGVVSGALIVKTKGFGRWSLFRPAQTQASAVLVRDAALLATLFEALPGFAWTIEMLAIDPRYSPDILSQRLPQIAHVHALTIGISSTTGFKDYWEKRPKKLVANVDRYGRRAEKEFATLDLEKIEHAAQMNEGVARFGALESSGWKGAAGTAVSADNDQGAFYREVLRRFAQTNQATIYELYAAKQLASSRLVICSGDMVVFLKTTYDESLSRVAPGRILLHRVIADQLTHHPHKTIEFYTNATRDQAEWASFDCAIQSVQIFRNNACAGAFAVLKVIRRGLTSSKKRKEPSANELMTPLVKSFRALDDDAAAALDLSDVGQRDDLETSLGWFELLRKTVFPDDQGIRYYCAEANDRITTVLPVRLVTNGLVKTIESLGNFYTYLYAPILSPGADLLTLNPLIAAATRDHDGAHVMRFSPMDPASPAYAGLLRALRANDWIPLPFFCFGNWFHPIEGSWENYLKRRGRNLRSSIKRRTSRFAAAGGSIEIVAAPEQVEMAIEAFQEIYTASWKRPEPYAQFIPSLIRDLAARGMLRLGIACLGERTVAAQLWIVAQGKASIFKVAYHTDFASFSPGTVLTAHLFQHVIERDQVHEIDFLIGDDKYKRIWMSDRRERWGIVAYNPRTLIGLTLLVREVSWRVAKSVVEKIKAAFENGQMRFRNSPESKR